jgi:hypothetical protein
MIQDDNKKSELFNDYFCKQADLNDSETSVPDITDILINGLEQITYFHSDGKVESVNDKLNSVHKGYLSIDAASLKSLGFNRSGPIALDVSSIFN